MRRAGKGDGRGGGRKGQGSTARANDNDEKHGDGADSREGEFLLITICVLRRVCQENCPSILL